jgi:hypothetical protein
MFGNIVLIFLIGFSIYAFFKKKNAGPAEKRLSISLIAVFVLFLLFRIFLN